MKNVPSGSLLEGPRNRVSAEPQRLVDATRSERPRLGYVYILSLPFAASVAVARGVDIAGFNYTGWIWMVYLAAGILILAVDRALHNPGVVAFLCRPWLVWFGFVWLSLLWTEDVGRRNVQEAMQITMPLLIGVMASVFIRTQAQVEQLLAAFRWSVPLLAVSAIVANLAQWKGIDLMSGIRPSGMTASLAACVFLGQLPDRPRRSVGGWVAAIVINFLMGARTILVSLVVLLFVNPLIKGLGKRLVAGTLIGLLAIGIFHTPQFQERFFYSGHGSIKDLSGDDMRGSGRFDAWPHIFREASRHPVLGKGIGTVYDFVPTVWAGIRQVHNDFLRVFFELGVVGLALFVPTLIWQTYQLWKKARTARGTTRCIFAAGFLGMLVYLINACTDNPTGYNIWFTDPLFALIGAAYGASHEDRSSQQPWFEHAE